VYPLKKAWDLEHKVVGKCVNLTAFFYGIHSILCPSKHADNETVTAPVNIVTDIWLLALPIKPIVLSIPRPKKELIGLFFVFGMGAMSCIAGLVSFRLAMLDRCPDLSSSHAA